MTTRCHSLSLAVSPCHLLYYSLSFVVSLVVIRCHSLSFVAPLVVTRCHLWSLVVICGHSLSFDVSLVCLFKKDHLLRFSGSFYMFLTLKWWRIKNKISFYEQARPYLWRHKDQNFSLTWIFHHEVSINNNEHTFKISLSWCKFRPN